MTVRKRETRVKRNFGNDLFYMDVALAEVNVERAFKEFFFMAVRKREVNVERAFEEFFFMA